MPQDFCFSVIIPTHNRPRLLVRCLQSVLAQTFPAGCYEVIVVDDGSSPATARVLQPYMASGRVRALRQAQQGWGAARRAGAQVAQYEQLAFLDDDCAAPPGWLAAYAAAYTAHPDVAGVAGGLRPGPRVNVAGWKQYCGHLDYFRRLNAPLGARPEQPGRVWFSFGGNRTFRREVWLAAQPATPWWYADDTAIDLRLRAQEAVIYYEPAAWVEHHYVLTVGQRLRAAYRYGRSEAHWRAAPADLRAVLAQLRARPHIPASSRWPSTAPGLRPGDWLWYVLTQPFVRLARVMGRWRGAVRGK